MTRAPTNESTDPGSANPTPPCWVFVPIGDDWAPDLPARAAREG